MKFIPAAQSENPRLLPEPYPCNCMFSKQFLSTRAKLTFNTTGKQKYFGLNFCTILYFDSSVYEPRPVRTATCCVTTHSEGFPPSRLTHLHLYPPSPPTQKARKKNPTPKQKEKSQKNKTKLLNTTVEIIIIIKTTKNLKNKLKKNLWSLSKPPKLNKNNTLKKAV